MYVSIAGGYGFLVMFVLLPRMPQVMDKGRNYPTGQKYGQ